MTALGARVKAHNTVREAAKKIFSQMQEALKPFIGQQLYKVDGNLLKKVADVIRPIVDQYPDLTIYRMGSLYNLIYVVKTSVNENGVAYYAEVSMYLAETSKPDMESGVLYSMSEMDENAFRSDYTEDEVNELRRVFNQKRDEFEKARSALYPFGEYDH